MKGGEESTLSPRRLCLVAFWRGGSQSIYKTDEQCSDNCMELTLDNGASSCCNYATTQLDERRSSTLRKQLNNHTIVRGGPSWR